MNIFEKQFEQLSSSQKSQFLRKFGKNPWLSRRKDLAFRMSWKQALASLPEWPRWNLEAIQGKSPLWMALRAKNYRAAKEILAKTTSLSRKDGSDCALLTLRWAPDLLEGILDRTPGGTFYWLRHEISLEKGSKNKLCMKGSLLMIAAALNDLPSLELLIRRGDPIDFQFQRDRWKIVRDLLPDKTTTHKTHTPTYSLIFSSVNRERSLSDADPLSAAIFCNSKTCALRLLREPDVTVTTAVCRALASTPENETQKAVIRYWNRSMEDLLSPEDFEPESNHSAIMPVLRRYRKLPRQNLEWLLHKYLYHKYDLYHAQLMELFSLVDPALLGDVVWEIWNTMCQSEFLELARELNLTLDRCRVPSTSGCDLNALLRNFQITGKAPNGCLSGLSAAMLNTLYNDNTFHELLLIPEAIRVLETEDPQMIVAWLNHHSQASCQKKIPSRNILILLSQLNIRKEVSYEL